MALTPKKDTGRTKPNVEVRFRNGGLRTERCKVSVVHRLVADLLERGLKHAVIHEQIFDHYLENRLRFFGHEF